MGARQGAAAQIGVERKCRCETGSDICESLVLQPANIEIAAIERYLWPTEKDVGCRLKHALPDHHPLAVIGIGRRSRKSGEH